MTRNLISVLCLVLLLCAFSYVGNQHHGDAVTSSHAGFNKAYTAQAAFIQQEQLKKNVAAPPGDIIEMPDEPQTQGYAPTSIKDFEAADPTEGISMISTPTANNLGNAVLSFNMNLPEGRNGMNPLISISYNSEGGSSWMGTGWNLSSPAIGIDTRWGVPRYDATLETEMYLLNGEQLAPVNNRDTLVPRAGEKQFYQRVERDFNKIIRHGNSPLNYWWEVDEKNGLKHYYGGRPGVGVVNTAVLKDDVGNVAYWALVESRDLNSNFVRYEYDTVSDPGIVGSTQPGKQLYLGRVFYTGNGTTMGSYKLEFVRDRTLNEQLRQDITIDGKLGFKMVSADLLRKVRVSFNNSIIRSYDFTYAEGAFYKTVLKSIKEIDNNNLVFYKQDFDYFDDARVNDSTYKSRDTSLAWQVADDNIRGNIANPIPQFEDNASVINTAKVSSTTTGVVVTVGGIAGGVWSKKLSVGGGFTYGKDYMEEITSLIDINGDGLPDKVFKDGTSLYYRPNLGVSTRGFGQRKPITGISAFSTSETDNIGGGVQAIPYSGFFGYNHTTSTTTAKVYFSDFNGDGLIDIAAGGFVYFNHLNINGDPEFATDSKLTPSPVFSGSLDPAFTQKDTARQGKQERDFPLQDIIRCWEAPVDGTVTITAPVQLIDVPNQTGMAKPRKDGVRVSIQRGPDTLWSASIGPTDFTIKTPTNVSGLTVTKGQRIYFRLQSIYNGEDDLVNWDPIIQYNSTVLSQSDAHHKASNYYRASEDFILHNRNGTGMGKQGMIVIDGSFKKQVTSDSVFIQVDRERNGVVTNFFQKGFGGNELVDDTIQVPGQFAVDTSDVLHFALVSRSYIDRSAIQWVPHYAYVVINDGTPVTTSGGSPTIQEFPIPDNSNFNNWLRQADAVTVAQQDTVILWPQVTGGGDGSLWFSVKGNDTVYARRRIFVNGGAMNTDMDSIHLIRKAGEPLFMEYATDSMTFANAIAAPTVLVYRDSSYTDSTGAVRDTTILSGTLAANLYTNPAQEWLGPLFRGWGYFGFKGDKGNGAIDETKLNMNEFTSYPTDPNVYTDSASMGNIPDPSKANFVAVYPNVNNQSWTGYDSSVYVKAGTMSSSRLYLHDVFVDTLSAGAGAVYKEINTETNSYSLGITAGGVGPSAGKSDATTYVSKDMLDINGDRYPDVVVLGTGNPLQSQPVHRIQYTLPNGGLGSSINTNVGNTVSSGYQEGLGMGGEYEKAFTSNRASFASGGAQNTAKSSMGVSGSVNWNQDFTESSWIDMNGDGLVDRVFDNGAVMLNLGYKFLPPEQWNLTGIDAAMSLSYGGGLGVNIDGGSYEGGFGISRTEGRNYHLITDMNNDGLPDRLYQNNSEVKVRINKGNGFGPEIPWKGFSDIASVYSVGESFNLAITVTIPIYIIFLKIAINPSGNYGHGTSRQEQAFMDLDGDGYADYVQSKDDGQLFASSSAIGRTNLLRSVTGPIGGSFFSMDYDRVGNTYDMPQSKWVLKQVTVFDGVPGDGVDTTRSQFAYEGGHQDRHEREFYGFNRVIARDLNTARNNKVYRSRIQQFLNSSYYNKGLLSSEWTEDSAGRKCIQTNYLYDVDSVRDYVRFPSLKQTEKLFFEGAASTNVKTTVQYQYDALGNVTRISDAGDGSQGDMKITNITYHDNNALYVKSVPSSVETTTIDGQKRKRTTAINSLGIITTIQDFLADGTAATTDLEYDGYGNVTKLTKPANYKNQRMSYVFEYDNTVHSYPVKVTDAFGYVTTNEYDYRFGAVTRTVSRNSEPTRYTIDNHGRITTFTGPYELAAGKPYTIAIDYHPEAAVPYTVTRHYDPEYNDDINVYNFADGLGRSIQVKKQISYFKGKNIADDVRMVVSGTDNFDAFGRVVESYYPVMEAKGTINTSLNGDLGKFLSRTTFDAVNRTVKKVLADGTTTTAAYTTSNGMISRMVTDPLGTRKETLTDVRGRKRMLKEYPGGAITTRYEYNALNEIIKVIDNDGNILSAVYDNIGRKTSVQHPDAGRTEFQYDLSGNLTKKITAQIRKEIPNNGAIQYQYDYDRLTQIDYPRQYQNQVRYLYGDSGAKAGRVILQQDASGGQEFFYSKQGQIVKTIRTVMTSPLLSTTYVSEQEFDSWNRLKKMVYPDGEEVIYHYNKSGGLRSMDGTKRGSSYQLVDQLGYDEFDQRVYMKYNNGTENYYAYDSLRRRLSQLKALSPNGQAMMNNNYQYDAVSNVLSVVNNRPGGTVKHDYHYDILYRMDSASGELSGDAGSGRYGLKINYDNLDNVLRKTMSGTGGAYDQPYTYNGTGPHQASQVGSNNYTYDMNGNQLGYGDIENFYDEENRLMAVVNKGVLSQFTYDADDIRVVKSSGGMQNIWVNGAPAGAVKHADNYTVYVSPYVSAKSAEFTKHYYIDGDRVASRLGHGTFTNISFPQSGLTAGGVDYTRRAALMEKARNEYYASLGVSPGPPTDKNFWAKPENSGIAAPVFTDTTASNIPPGWPGNTSAPPFGPPVFVSPIPSRDSVKAGYGFQEAGHIYEGSIYFYHFNHTGSTNYVTNFTGEVIQHVEYAASGEIFFNEHTGSFETKFLFNGKGLDDETGYYFYGPQYYDPVLSQWLNVFDPSGEGFLANAGSGYSVTGDNADDDIVSNPVVGKISYSGSSSTETIWSDKSYGSNSDDNKTSKEQMRKVNNKARRKIVANRYANNLSDFRFNSKDKDNRQENTARLNNNVLQVDASELEYNGIDAINLDEDMDDNDMDGNRGVPTRARRNAMTSRPQSLSRQRSSSVVNMHGFQSARRLSRISTPGLQRMGSNSIVVMHGFQRQRSNSGNRSYGLPNLRKSSGRR